MTNTNNIILSAYLATRLDYAEARYSIDVDNYIHERKTYAEYRKAYCNLMRDTYPALLKDAIEYERNHPLYMYNEDMLINAYNLSVMLNQYEYRKLRHKLLALKCNGLLRYESSECGENVYINIFASQRVYNRIELYLCDL